MVIRYWLKNDLQLAGVLYQKSPSLRRSAPIFGPAAENIANLKSDRLGQRRAKSRCKVESCRQILSPQMINRKRLNPHIGPKPDHSKATLSIAAT